jgi:hypothetical protein
MTLMIRSGIVLLALAPALASAEQFDWLIAPYGWLPGISVDQSGEPDPGGGGGVSGSDILEKTESVFMFRFEAARNRWGLLVDYITLGLADQSTLTPPPPFDISVDIDGELDLDVTEVAAFYRPSGEVEGVNFLGRSVPSRPCSLRRIWGARSASIRTPTSRTFLSALVTCTGSAIAGEPVSGAT